MFYSNPENSIFSNKINYSLCVCAKSGNKCIAAAALEKYTAATFPPSYLPNLRTFINLKFFGGYDVLSINVNGLRIKYFCYFLKMPVKDPCKVYFYRL